MKITAFPEIYTYYDKNNKPHIDYTDEYGEKQSLECSKVEMILAHSLANLIKYIKAPGKYIVS